MGSIGRWRNSNSTSHSLVTVYVIFAVKWLMCSFLVSDCAGNFNLYLNTDEVKRTLVPTIWLCNDNKECYWPTFHAGSAIKLRKKPKDSWQKCPVLILETGIESYDKGRRHQARAEDNLRLQTTDAETPVSRLRNRRKVNKQKPRLKLHKPSLQAVSTASPDHGENSDSSSLSSYRPLPSDDDVELLQRLDALRDAQEKDATGTTDNSADQHLEGYFTPQKDINSIYDRVLTLERRQEAFEKIVLNEITGIKADVKEILLWTKSKDSSHQQKLLEDIPFDFPLKSYEELQNLDQWIEDEANRRQLVSYCSRIGGSGSGKIVRNILSTILSSDLSKTLNFVGANGKHAFRNLRLKRVVIDATRSNAGKEQCTDAKVDSIIKRWLQNSRDLDGGRTARKASHHNVVLQE